MYGGRVVTGADGWYGRGAGDGGRRKVLLLYVCGGRALGWDSRRRLAALLGDHVVAHVADKSG